MLSPNWMNRLPGGPAHADPDGFLGRQGLVDYLERYARSFDAPVVEGVEVERVGRSLSGFRVDTSAGPWIARNVVVATGDADVPHVPFPAPRGVPACARLRVPSPCKPPGRPACWSSAPARAGSSSPWSCARRGVTSCSRPAGTRDRRARYRGRDIFEWLQLLGDFDRTIDELPDLEAAKRVPLVPAQRRERR